MDSQMECVIATRCKQVHETLLEYADTYDLQSLSRKVIESRNEH